MTEEYEYECETHLNCEIEWKKKTCEKECLKEKFDWHCPWEIPVIEDF